MNSQRIVLVIAGLLLQTRSWDDKVIFTLK
jgi:hypothetical protein